MTTIKHIYSFGDSHVAGDELCSPEVPELIEYLKTVECDSITGAVKMPQQNLDKISTKVRELYKSYYTNQSINFKLLESQKSFSSQLSKLLDCSFDNYAENGSSNLQSYVKFCNTLPKIKTHSNTLKDNERILIIYGLTEIERSTFFNHNTKALARSPLWNLHNEHRKDAEKYIELLDMFGDDTLAKLYKIYMQVNAVRGQVPNNCDVVFVDPGGLFVDKSTVKVPELRNLPFIRVQSYKNFVDDSHNDTADQVLTSIRDCMFNDCLFSTNVHDRFVDKNDFFKLMPLSHFTEQHHKQFAHLLYSFIIHRIKK